MNPIESAPAGKREAVDTDRVDVIVVSPRRASAGGGAEGPDQAQGGAQVDWMEAVKRGLKKTGRHITVGARALMAFLGRLVAYLRNGPPTRAVRAYWRRRRLQLMVSGLLLSLVLLFFWPSFMITVDPGEAGVEWSRFRGGTILDRVYPEGMHLFNPFNKVYIYNVRKQAIQHEMTALTVTGLPVAVSLSIRFHPEYNFLPVMHQRIGPDYANVIVVPEVEAVLRSVIGRFTPEELFTTQGGVLEKLVVGAFTEVGKDFITLDDVVVRKIVLPDRLTMAIESKLTQEQLMLEYAFKLQREEKEAERRIIESRGISAYNKTVDGSLTERLLTWQGITATRELAASPNSKVIVVGNGRGNLPVILSSPTP